MTRDQILAVFEAIKSQGGNGQLHREHLRAIACLALGPNCSSAQMESLIVALNGFVDPCTGFVDVERLIEWIYVEEAPLPCQANASARQLIAAAELAARQQAEQRLASFEAAERAAMDRAIAEATGKLRNEVAEELRRAHFAAAADARCDLLLAEERQPPTSSSEEHGAPWAAAAAPPPATDVFPPSAPRHPEPPPPPVPAPALPQTVAVAPPASPPPPLTLSSSSEAAMAVSAAGHELLVSMSPAATLEPATVLMPAPAPPQHPVQAERSTGIAGCGDGDPQALHPGDRVALQGLRTNLEMNGEVGILESWHNDGIWIVCLDNGERVSVKPHHVTLLMSATDSMAASEITHLPAEEYVRSDAVTEARANIVQESPEAAAVLRGCDADAVAAPAAAIPAGVPDAAGAEVQVASHALAQAVDDGGLAPGMVVQLVNLASMPSLNGAHGTVLSWESQRGLWHVEIPALGSTRAMPVAKLQVVPQAPAPPWPPSAPEPPSQASHIAAGPSAAAAMDVSAVTPGPAAEQPAPGGPPASPGSPGMMRPGDHVRLRSLVDRADLNGACALVEVYEERQLSLAITVPETVAVEQQPESQRTAGHLQSGQRVWLCNLQRHPELNGQEAVLQAWYAQQGCWTLQLVASGVVRAILPHHVSLVAPAEAAAPAAVTLGGEVAAADSTPTEAAAARPSADEVATAEVAVSAPFDADASAADISATCDLLRRRPALVSEGSRGRSPQGVHLVVPAEHEPCTQRGYELDPQAAPPLACEAQASVAVPASAAEDAESVARAADGALAAGRRDAAAAVAPTAQVNIRNCDACSATGIGPQSTKLRPGVVAKLQGLRKKHELNGERVVLDKLVIATGYWLCKLGDVNVQAAEDNLVPDPESLAEASKLVPDAIVEITGLVNSAHFNGAQAMIVGVEFEAGCYSVRMVESRDLRLVRPDKIRLV
eukprot:TRINITY_DN14039_c0_g2_i2.p1 TRINITY_DN14039_c0_g2~~TRINITY_DN14039_c0_g2_i2.p1  ORF type:complete len:946 (-),score=210.92 TRINITY_DN14039_c0_g2_i2:68-2905(-)